MEPWWVAKFDAQELTEDELDGLGCELIDCGAAGTEISNEQLLCYIQANDEGIENFKKNVDSLPLNLISIEEVPSVNWVQKCEDVWHKLEIGDFTITPVISLEKGMTTETASNEILVIPSSGFGTGHHATTRQPAAILQMPLLREIPITRCLDMGCGSALLAIIANKLFKVKVDAVDIDPDALVNARENCTINHCIDDINIIQADLLTWTQGGYDLVMANLYAELLERAHDILYQAVKKNAWLIISGFHDISIPELSKYAEPLWQRIEIRKADDWSAVLLRKNDN